MRPVLIELGPITLYTYGLFLGLALLACLMVGRKELERRGKDPDMMFDLLLLAAVGGLLGARIFFVAYNWELFMLAPLEALFIWNGGLTLYGGLLGGTTVILAYVYFKEVELPLIADIAGLCLPIGIAVGRLGCYFNGCCYGEITSLWPGIVIPGAGGLPRHPTQLYEFIFMLALFLTLWFVKDKFFSNGALLFIFFTVYGLFRFSIEFIRVNPDYIFGLTGSQVSSLLLVIIGVSFFLKRLYLKIKYKTEYLKNDETD